MMYREKLMPEAWASPLDNFDAEKGALFEELDNEKILLPAVGGTLPCHGTA
jgi:hypothetical protein